MTLFVKLINLILYALLLKLLHLLIISSIEPEYISPKHLSFVANITEIQEPNLAWVKDMAEGINALEQNLTWEVTGLHADKTPIG